MVFALADTSSFVYNMAVKFKLLLAIILVTQQFYVSIANNCVEFSQEGDVQYKSLTRTLTFRLENKCQIEIYQVALLTVVVKNSGTSRVLCNVVTKKGWCTPADACTCPSRTSYQVTWQVKDASLNEQWQIHAMLAGGFQFTTAVEVQGWKGNNAVSVSESETSTKFVSTEKPVVEAVSVSERETSSNVVSTEKPIVEDVLVTTEAGDTDTQGFQFPVTLIVLSSSLAAAVVIIFIVIAVSCRLRHRFGQVNPRSAEVEMVPIYSRPDPDVHHYLGLPPNRHAPTDDDDEGGYMEVIDSRPESTIYTAPKESPSLPMSLPSNVPEDYLHPVASTQE